MSDQVLLCWKYDLLVISKRFASIWWSNMVINFTIFDTTSFQSGDLIIRVKTHNLFRVDENSLEQCCAAHIVQCCQQYCSALLHLTAGYFTLNSAEQ